jgi:hypothetical protein
MTGAELLLWQVLEDADRDDVLHVVPLTEWREHVATPACWCNPQPDPRYGGAHVHNSPLEPQQIH